MTSESAKAPTEYETLRNAVDTAPDVPCRADANDLWWSEKRADQDEAADRCYDCPVFTQCRAYSLAAMEPWGTWGGMTEWDRTGKKTRGRPPRRKIDIAA